ncbi:MAG TPA: protein phosphatase 2C domain-containing protein [Isosphaeraceae bacterium]|nr:protein phosphatase 2C domain-containing protein [Isosphaeraceae bacterium]
MNWEDIIVEAAATDTGMRRSNNQDSFTIVRAPSPTTWRQRGHLYMVADGMGAHAVGELASKLACDNIPHNYFKAKNGTPAEALSKAFHDVGALIHGKAAANRDFQGMGTTCSTLLMLPAGAVIAHVGDSRVYRVREGRIDQLTFDHSLVWELVRRNHMAPEQAARAVPRNVITRSLGPEPQVEVDLEGPVPVEPGDVFVLCSDGLSGPVSDPEIGAFASSFHPEDACRYLIHLANLRGGPDNITALVLRVGPWVDPSLPHEGDEAPDNGARKGGKGFLAGLLGAFARRPAEPEVEEHLYTSADCPADGPLIDGLTEVIRHAQAVAVEQSWNVDWPVIANLRREAEEARAGGDLRAAVRCCGEAISHLGLAARAHRKAAKGAGVS